jgi:hypothetical protein
MLSQGVENFFNSNHCIVTQKQIHKALSAETGLLHAPMFLHAKAELPKLQHILCVHIYQLSTFNTMYNLMHQVI